MPPTPTSTARFNAEAAAWDANPDMQRASASALQAILAAEPSLFPKVDDTAAATTTTTKTSPDILEIGCGTGLLTLRMAPHAHSILAVDAAPGMIEALAAKLDDMPGEEDDEARRVVTPLCLLLEDPEDPRLPAADADAAVVIAAVVVAAGDGGGGGGGSSDGDSPSPTRRKKFDLVTSHLVLHHVPDQHLAPLLRTMHGCLRPGGRVALTDFEDFGPEARRFHPEAKMLGVERHGIRAGWFAALMREVGFVDVEVGPAWSMEKEVERFPGEWGENKPEGVELEKMMFPFLLCRGTREV